MRPAVVCPRCSPNGGYFRLWYGKSEPILSVFFSGPFIEDDNRLSDEPRFSRPIKRRALTKAYLVCVSEEIDAQGRVFSTKNKGRISAPLIVSDLDCDLAKRVGATCEDIPFRDVIFRDAAIVHHVNLALGLLHLASATNAKSTA